MHLYSSTRDLGMSTCVLIPQPGVGGEYMCTYTPQSRAGGEYMCTYTPGLFVNQTRTFCSWVCDILNFNDVMWTL